MPAFTDQLGRLVVLNATPKRIVSLVPSQTELLFDLGLDAEIVGITKYCIKPEHAVRSKAIIGGTKQLNLSLIRSLNPDLIIANKEENERSQIEALAVEYPVYISDVDDLDGALQMINAVGQITGRSAEASLLSVEISSKFNELSLIPVQPLNILYLIWRKPWMAAGQGTFINDMLTRCGWLNVLKETRYPQLTEEIFKASAPDVVLLSSEPYPFKEKHMSEIQQILPQAQVILVDGELFSWYGSRLLHSPEYFMMLINSLK